MKVCLIKELQKPSGNILPVGTMIKVTKERADELAAGGYIAGNEAPKEAPKEEEAPAQKRKRVTRKKA
jgi:hypothetical protein